MRLFLAIGATVMAAFAAGPGDAKEPGQRPPAVTAVKPLEIPAGAVEAGAGLYRFTDPQGKKWVYRRTPFAVVRWQDDASGQAGDSKIGPATQPAAGAADAVPPGHTTPFRIFTQDQKPVGSEPGRPAGDKQQDRAAGKQD